MGFPFLSVTNEGSVVQFVVVVLIVSETVIRLDALLSSFAISFFVLHSVFVESVCSEYSCTVCFVLHEEHSKSKIVKRYNSFFIGL